MAELFSSIIKKEPEFGARLTILSPAVWPELPPQIFLAEPELLTLTAPAVPRMTQLPLKCPATTKLELDPGAQKIDVRVMPGISESWLQVLVRAFFHVPDLGVQSPVPMISVGEVPGQTTLQLGRVAEIAYLGHPDTMLRDLMMRQADEYDPDLVLGYLKPDYDSDRPTPDQTKRILSRSGRIVLKTTPVTRLTFTHDLTFDHQHQPAPFSYQAQALFFIELSVEYQKTVTHKERTKSYQPRKLRLGVSLLADDNILRVYHSTWLSTTYREPNRKGVVKDITDLRPLSRALAALPGLAAQTELPLTQINEWAINSGSGGLEADPIELQRLAPHLLGWQVEKKRKPKKKV